MSDKFPSATRARSSKDVIAQYLMSIVSELSPGSKIPSENQLAKQFGVSRSAVREATSGVASLGLLEIRKGSGMFVRAHSGENLEFRDVDYSDLANLAKFLEIRAGLDAAAARIAALRRTEGEIRFLREMITASFRPEIPIADAVKADIAFHLAIVRATHNEYFVSLQTFLLGHLQAGILLTRTLESYSEEMVKEVHREHNEILQAIEVRNPDLAWHLAEQHVVNARRRMRTAFAAHPVH